MESLPLRLVRWCAVFASENLGDAAAVELNAPPEHAGQIRNQEVPEHPRDVPAHFGGLRLALPQHLLAWSGLAWKPLHRGGAWRRSVFWEKVANIG